MGFFPELLEQPDRIDLQLWPALSGLAAQFPESLSALRELEACQLIFGEQLRESHEALKDTDAGPNLLRHWQLSTRLAEVMERAGIAAQEAGERSQANLAGAFRESTHEESLGAAFEQLTKAPGGTLAMNMLGMLSVHLGKRIQKALDALTATDAPVAAVIPELVATQAELRELGELLARTLDEAEA